MERAPGQQTPPVPGAEELVREVRASRRRTLAFVEGLDDDRLLGPKLDIVNPLLWEIGHVAWFQEKWVLRHLGGAPPLRPDTDRLYDSKAVAHDTRWDLPLPPLDETVSYLAEVRDRVVERIDAARNRGLSTAEVRLVLLALDHEDMHCEAFTYTRQTLGWPTPEVGGGGDADSASGAGAGPLPGDVECPGGVFYLGAPAAYPYALDNEEWEHPVEVAPFRIARAPVTQADLAAFAEDGGYRRRELWSQEGWSWREAAGAEAPAYWQRGDDGSWRRRVFDRWVPLEPHRPAVHVSWYEAEAFCRWAGRRLPTEAEWELAAAGVPGTDGALEPSGEGRKRYFPWGVEPPDPGRANLGWTTGGTVDVAALATGDSALGCRQMAGNVWEWTATDFRPYPGFSPGPYREYSEPWFGERKVLRGGSWATSDRMIRNTWRNYFTPDRRDVFAGFRTCPR